MKQSTADVLRQQSKQAIGEAKKFQGESSNNKIDDETLKLLQQQKQQINNAIDLYKPGQFSKFAVQQESKMMIIKQLVDKVINQAIQSHLKQVENYLDIQQKQQKKSKQLQDKFKGYFSNQPDKIYEFLNDPIKSTLQNEDCTDIKLYIDTFIQRVLTMHELAIIQGKLVRIRDYKINQYIRDEQTNAIYIESKIFENTFLKYQDIKVPSHVFLSEGKFRQRSDLMKMNETQRTTIIGMVYMYLKQRKILMTEKQIEIQLEKNIHKGVTNIQNKP